MGDYNLSFTAGSLLPVESAVIAELYLELQDWNAVKSMIADNNVLKKTAASTADREFSEIKKRLDFLNSSQLELLVSGDLDQKKQILFLAVCKTYPLIREFVNEVIQDKVAIFEKQITEDDFYIFWNKRAATHDKLEDIAQSTKKKLKQVLFLILTDVGLLKKEYNTFIILTPYLSETVRHCIMNDNPKWLEMFLQQ